MYTCLNWAIFLAQFNIIFYSHSISIVAVYHAIISADSENKNRSHEDILANYPPKLGITNELCAGIVDKSKPLVEIAREEVLEECGYNVPVERFELVLTYRYVYSNTTTFIQISSEQT